MIHELREYRIDVRAADAYFSLFRDLAMPIRGSAYGRLVANWLIPGEVVTFYHLWEYDSLVERTAKRAALARVERWTRDFLPGAAALVSSQRLTILTPYAIDGLPGFAIGDFAAAPIVFTTIRCRTGKAAAVASAVAAARPPGLRGVWTEEMPDPNAVWYVCDRGEAPASDWLEAHGAVHRTTKTCERGPY